MFFTQKNGALYVILPKWPEKKIIVKGVKAASNARISVLGQKGDLKWTKKGADLEIELPEECMYDFTTEEAYAYVLKISKINKK